MATYTFNTCRVLLLSLPILFAMGCSSSSDSDDLLPEIGAAVPDTLAGPNGNYGPYEATALAAFERYNGNEELAEFIGDTKSAILDMVLFGPLSAGDNKLFSSGYLAPTLMRHSPDDLIGLTNSSETDYQLCANQDGSGLMNWGVSATLANDASLREVNLSYTNCLIEGKLVNGSVVFASGAQPLNGGTPAHYFRYDNLTVTQADNSTWAFNGVEALPAGASCDASGAAQSYFTAENVDNGETWLFDNLVTTLYEGSAGNRCASLVSEDTEETVYSGTLANSFYGVVNVSQNVPTDVPGHAVGISGAEGYAVEYVKVFQDLPADVDTTGLQVHVDSVAFARVTASENGFEAAPLEQALSAVRLGGFLPLTDIDQDGLTDGYVLAYNLGDSGANDDVDQDGLTALEELAAGSNPINPRENGWLVDRQITVLSSPADEGATTHEFFVSIDNQAERLSAGEFEFSVSVSGGATFASTDAVSTPSLDFLGNSTTFADVACEYSNNALNELQCSSASDEVCATFNEAGQSVVECDSNLLLQRKFSVDFIPGERFSITAEIAPHALERNTANNTAVGSN